MTTDRDPTTRIVRSWLQTNEYDSADRVLDRVLELLDTTPQRRATPWPVRRLSQMNNMARLAMAAAAVVVAALIGIGFLLPGGPRIGGPGPSMAPAVTPDATPAALRAGALDAGTYIAHPLDSNPSLAVTFTVPDGWQAATNDAILPEGDGSTQGPDGMAMAFHEITGLYSNPCDSLGDPDVDAGSTAQELGDAFTRTGLYGATVEDLTLAGYSGKQVELQLPSDLDPASCPYDEFFVFEGGPYSQGPGNRWHLSILDVEGSRLVIFTHDFAGTSPADRAELASILDSISIDPGS